MRSLTTFLSLLLLILISHSEAQELPCVIRGTVYAAEDTPTAEQQFIEKLKTVSTSDEFRTALEATTRPARQPAAGAVVTARGKHLTQTATTDAAGNYLMRVLVEEYEVSASAPGTNQASASKLVYADRGRRRDLQLRDDIITIKGKVTDADGRAVAGARVVAEQSIDSQTNETLPDRVSTTTAADGTYELKGVEPQHLWTTAGYLSGGTGGDGFQTVITASAPGMRKQALTVPPITETRLPRAQQLLQKLVDMSKRAGGKQEMKPKEGPYTPKSKGNDILDIDLTLRPE